MFINGFYFFSEDKDERSEKEVHNVSRDESMDTDEDTNNPHQTTNNNDDEGSVRCPLCQEGFPDKETLEDHAMSIHSINGEGLARLMMLMQGSHWLNSNKNSKDDDENSGIVNNFFQLFPWRFFLFKEKLIYVVFC